MQLGTLAPKAVALRGLSRISLMHTRAEEPRLAPASSGGFALSIAD